MVLPDERKLPLPEADDDVKKHKWDVEIPVGEGLPRILPPGQSVRFATWKEGMEIKLRQAGFTGYVDYAVEVEDASGNTYRAGESALVHEPPPEP